MIIAMGTTPPASGPSPMALPAAPGFSLKGRWALVTGAGREPGVAIASNASALMTGSAVMLDGGWTSTS